MKTARPSPTSLVAPDFRVIGQLDTVIDIDSNSVIYAKLNLRDRKACIQRIGPDVEAESTW